MTTNGDGGTTLVYLDGLSPVGTRQPMGRYLRRIWNIRSFLLANARYRSLSSGRGTLLGRIWLILDPFLNVAMYYVIFALLLKANRGIENFVAFLAIGIILFSPVSGALNGGASVLERNRGLMRGFAFPRASLVFSDSLRSFYDSLPDVAALLVFIAVVPPHVVPSWTWLFIIPILLLRQVFITGLMFFTARLSSSIPDLKHVWPLLARFWFYGSGVIFSIDHYVQDPTALAILKANPGAVLLEMARDALMYATVPEFALWLQFVGWALAFLSFGILVFASGEEKYNRVR